MLMMRKLLIPHAPRSQDTYINLVFRIVTMGMNGKKNMKHCRISIPQYKPQCAFHLILNSQNISSKSADIGMCYIQQLFEDSILSEKDIWYKGMYYGLFPKVELNKDIIECIVPYFLE